MENVDRTEIESLGEFGLIKHLTGNNEYHQKSTEKGVGDDAAVIDAGDHFKVISTDLLVENIHFDLMYVPLKHLGYKSIVVNLSDIYAMNAKPTQVTVSIAISNRVSVEALEELYEGIYTACKVYGVDLVGGDTSSSPHGITISVTAIGEVAKDKVVYRSGAKEGDLLVVSGDLGGAYMGLQVLEREKAVFQDDSNVQPDLSGVDYILERQLKPEARKDVIGFLEELEVQPNAMIDISDGLASEILHLCDQSELGCKLYEEKIPIDPTTVNTCEDFNLDPTAAAISGGEDYELLFTVKQEDYDKIKGSPHMTVIGHMVDKASGTHLVTRDNTQMPMTAQGWDAFLKQD